MVKLLNPFAVNRVFWPDSQLYDKQREVVWSVERNRETYVVAGNKLGV